MLLFQSRLEGKCRQFNLLIKYSKEKYLLNKCKFKVGNDYVSYGDKSLLCSLFMQMLNQLSSVLFKKLLLMFISILKLGIIIDFGSDEKNLNFMLINKLTNSF